MKFNRQHKWMILIVCLFLICLIVLLWLAHISIIKYHSYRNCYCVQKSCVVQSWAPPTKNSHAPPPTGSRNSYQAVNPFHVWAGWGFLCWVQLSQDYDNIWLSLNLVLESRRGQEIEKVIYQLVGWWFDPWPLQSACQIFFGKILTPNWSPM